MPFRVHWILALCCASTVGAVSYMRAELKAPSTVFSSINHLVTGKPPMQGYAVVALDTSARTIEYYISYTLSGARETGAHFHGFASPGQEAAVIYTLPSGQSGTHKGVWEYGNETDLQALELGFMEGSVHVEIHTDAFPSGEIRGQLVTRPPIQPRYIFAIDLAAASVASAKSTSRSSAFGMMLLQTDTGTLQYFIDYQGRDEGSTVENVSLHGFSPPGVNSGLIHPEELRSSPRDEDPPRISELMVIGMIEGMAYLQMYMDLFPDGGLRGQVVVAEKDYNIMTPWSEGSATADDGISGVQLPVGAFSEHVGMAADMVTAADGPLQGMVPYTKEMRIDIRPFRRPEQAIVFTIAGLQSGVVKEKRRSLGDRHVDPDDKLASIYWFNSTSSAWVEALGTSIDLARDISVVSVGLDVLSDPGFSWRLVGMRAESPIQPSPAPTPGTAAGMAASPWLCALLAVALVHKCRSAG